MKAETVKKMKTDALINKLKSIDDKYYDAVRNHSSTKIDFGYGMRAYSMLKNMSFRTTDTLKENAAMIKAELLKRGVSPHDIHTSFVK